MDPLEKIRGGIIYVTSEYKQKAHLMPARGSKEPYCEMLQMATARPDDIPEDNQATDKAATAATGIALHTEPGTAMGMTDEQRIRAMYGECYFYE